MTRLELPHGRGWTGLHVDGTHVLTSHWEDVKGTSRVRFYVDRIDVANPRQPRIVSRVNVPGSLYAWDCSSRRALTVDYVCNVESGVSYGTCAGVKRRLRLVALGESAGLEGTWDVPPGYELGAGSVGMDRVFVGMKRQFEHYGNCWGQCTCCVNCTSSKLPLLVVSDLSAGELRVSLLEADRAVNETIASVTAFGTRALVSTDHAGLLIVDATDAVNPRVARSVAVVGATSSVERYGNLAILSNGPDGVQVIDVSQ